MLMADFWRVAPPPFPHVPTQHVPLLEVPTFPALSPWELMTPPFVWRHVRLFVLSCNLPPAASISQWAWQQADGVSLHHTLGEWVNSLRKLSMRFVTRQQPARGNWHFCCSWSGLLYLTETKTIKMLLEIKCTLTELNKILKKKRKYFFKVN